MSEEIEPSQEAIYERARRFANNSIWTIALQCRRLQSNEPEDDEFIFRKWADFHFLLVALMKLRRSAVLAKRVQVIAEDINLALNDFDLSLPSLRIMRNTQEHFDEYAMDNGKDRNISRKQLEVSTLYGTKFEWLGHSLDVVDALHSGEKLYEAIKVCQSKLIKP